jgi:hypothetical protein
MRAGFARGLLREKGDANQRRRDGPHLVSSALDAGLIALGASFLTGAFSVGVVLLQQWRQARAASRAALEGALLTVLARSWSIVLRAGTMSVALQQRSPTFDDSIRVLLHLRRPLDHFELHDWLAEDWHPMVEGASTGRVSRS